MWEYIAPSLALLWTFVTESGAAYTYYRYTYYGYYGYYGYGYTISRGGIAGSVIGALVTIGVVIAIIVCVCMRRNRNPGQVVMMTPTNNTTVVSTTTGATQMYPGRVQPGAVSPQYPYNQAGYQTNQAPGIMPSGGPPGYGGHPSYGGQYPNGGLPPYGNQPPYNGQFPKGGEQPPNYG